MAAVTIDLSDDECCEVVVDRVAITSVPNPVSNKSLVADAELALKFQREEEQLAASRTKTCSFAPVADIASDEALAMRFQREEESAAARSSSALIVTASPCRKRPWTVAAEMGSIVTPSAPSRPSERFPTSPTAPLCSDAIALLRSCIEHASDASRSQFLLCGPTPFFHQHKRKRGGRTSNVAATSECPGQPSSNDVNARVNDGIGMDQPSDNWSCGYRNVQMLIGHLLQNGWAELFGGTVPDIPSLQRELERLWACGYDAEGCAQLGGRVQGTQKWIGTSEACVLLRGQSIRCNIIAFRGGVAQDGHGAESAAGAVVERAFRHFNGTASLNNGAISNASKPHAPLYLQHDGHSRTVVGVQRRREKGGGVTDFLLVLDPGLGESGFEDFVAASRRGRGWEKFVKRSLAPLRRKGEYELLMIETEGTITPATEAAARCVQRHV